MMWFLKNGFKILKRDRLFSLVNVIGLALGIFCFIITSLYVTDELTHDKWHSKVDRIYVPYVGSETAEGQISYNPPFAFHNEMFNNPGIEAVVNIGYTLTLSYELGEETFDVDNAYESESSLFQVFDFSLKLGDVNTALSEPNSVVLSNKIAQKHFGKLNPIGQFLQFKDKGLYKITGVLEEIPGNSHLQFDMLLSIDWDQEPHKAYINNWDLGYGRNYFLLKTDYSEKQFADDLERAYRANTKEYKKDNRVAAEAFKDLYLNGRVYSRRGIFSGQPKYIWIFSVAGSLILIVACFNYINLKVASSISRSKDLGIRKVLGASRSKLVSMLVGETAFISTIALIVALIAVEMVLPFVNATLGKRLDLSFMDRPSLLLLPLVAMSFVIILSGVYPAIISSKTRMASLLKGDSSMGGKSFLRKALVAFQFILCSGLLSGTLIIRGQASFLIKKDLGYNTENVHNIGMSGQLRGKYKELKAELERVPQIEMISASPFPNRTMGMLIDPDGEGGENPSMFKYGAVAPNFIEALELEIVQGQSFSELPVSELKDAVIINETAAQIVGNDNPIGVELEDRYTVVGVMKDFHFFSTKYKIEPILLVADLDKVRSLHFKFRQGEREAVMAQVKQIWNQFDADREFLTTDVSEFYVSQLRKERILISIFDLLSLMLITVSFLGLFALSSFEGQLRLKELTIRKVLGASQFHLMRIMNKNTLVLILIALVISIPITQKLISSWLNTFPYRVNNTIQFFVFSGISMVVISVGVLTLQTLSNANKSIVKTLRNE